ncbi:hypothetical protein CVT26_000157 [Gymnopilus dilepis]|uniref:Uncharacterized protein n=1 Tax=Gymnopilus dilepis TaxID=231916 RepID=A0A409WBJ9_9AGAR|nr:hypothetical protein CVT26_000157 [Gymnopilus dilepis]
MLSTGASYSIASPPQYDSDSDFRPGAYIPEPVVKKNKSRVRKARTSDATASGSAGPAKKKRRLEVLENTWLGGSKGKGKR